MAPRPMPWFRFYVEALRDRKLRSQPPSTRWLWVTLLGIARASDEPGVLLIDGIPATEEDIADEGALSLDEVRDGLAYFIERSMVVTDLAGRTVVRAFQERQYESDRSSHRTSQWRERNAAKNVPPSVVCSLLSEYEEKISVDDAFDLFWSTYPSKKSKLEARRAFDAALERASFDEILAGATRYRDDPHRNPEHTKYAQGWLNADRWNDGEVEASKNAARARTADDTARKVHDPLTLLKEQLAGAEKAGDDDLADEIRQKIEAAS